MAPRICEYGFSVENFIGCHHFSLFTPPLGCFSRLTLTHCIQCVFSFTVQTLKTTTAAPSLCSLCVSGGDRVAGGAGEEAEAGWGSSAGPGERPERRGEEQREGRADEGGRDPAEEWVNADVQLATSVWWRQTKGWDSHIERGWDIYACLKVYLTTLWMEVVLHLVLNLKIKRSNILIYNRPKIEKCFRCISVSEVASSSPKLSPLIPWSHDVMKCKMPPSLHLSVTWCVVDQGSLRSVSAPQRLRRSCPPSWRTPCICTERPHGESRAAESRGERPDATGVSANAAQQTHTHTRSCKHTHCMHILWIRFLWMNFWIFIAWG